MTVFSESDCKGYFGTAVVNYGQDVFFQDPNKPLNFLSFEISRTLEDKEQLDISHLGQDGGQTQTWSCGTYIMNYQHGTTQGCHNNPNQGPASCFRLWHY